MQFTLIDFHIGVKGVKYSLDLILVNKEEHTHTFSVMAEALEMKC